MIEFIDSHRSSFGVESICKQLPIAPSTYYEYKARARDEARVPSRVQSDRQHSAAIQRIHEDNLGVYGARKVWRQMRREVSAH